MRSITNIYSLLSAITRPVALLSQYCTRYIVNGKTLTVPGGRYYCEWYSPLFTVICVTLLSCYLAYNKMLIYYQPSVNILLS